MENENNQTPLCGLSKEKFLSKVDGKQTDLYILRNTQGCEVDRKSVV